MSRFVTLLNTRHEMNPQSRLKGEGKVNQFNQAQLVNHTAEGIKKRQAHRTVKKHSSVGRSQNSGQRGKTAGTLTQG